MSNAEGLTSKETGAIVTAQQAYDAFMTGPVLISAPNGRCYSVSSMYWVDANGGNSDPSNVKTVIFTLQCGSMYGEITIGSALS